MQQVDSKMYRLEEKELSNASIKQENSHEDDEEEDVGKGYEDLKRPPLK